MGTDAWNVAVARLVQALERLDARDVDALATAIESAPGSKSKARRKLRPDATVAYPELLAFALSQGLIPRVATRLWNILVRESETGRRGEESRVLLTVGVVKELATHHKSDFRNYGSDLQKLHRSWVQTL